MHVIINIDSSKITCKQKMIAKHLAKYSYVAIN